jgi:phosphoadenosine phosphosulfate reductase
MNEKNINKLQEELDGLSPERALARVADRFGEDAVFSTSFGIEDQVITHLIGQQPLPITLFTLDTGRLFPETYSVWSRTLEVYPIKIEAYFPSPYDLENFVHKKGPNAFYASVENRKTCCHIRKVEPLQRALKGKKIWITGLRKEHSPERKNLQTLEWDANNQIIKFHPLLHWSTQEIRNFVNTNGIPYNPLHDKGFVSIGCAPCTRAIREGEDFRAGRWWWEDTTKKECGLHT